MGETLSQSAYAKRIGISQPAIAKYIRQGKLEGAYVKQGSKYLIDPDRADIALMQNMDKKHFHDMRPQTDDTHDNYRVEDDKKLVDMGQMKYAEVRTLVEKYRAANAKLEYEIKRRKYILVDDVIDRIGKHILNAKARLLSIKGVISPDIIDVVKDRSMAHRLIDKIDKEIKSALLDLSQDDVLRDK